MYHDIISITPFGAFPTELGNKNVLITTGGLNFTLN